MQRLGELNNKVIVEQKTAPENKYVIWKDPVEGKFKEYKDGSWVESEEIAVPSSRGDFPYPYIQIDDINDIDISTVEYDDITAQYKRRKIGHVNLPSDMLFVLSNGKVNTRIANAFKYIRLDYVTNGPSSTDIRISDDEDSYGDIFVQCNYNAGSWGPETGILKAIGNMIVCENN